MAALPSLTPSERKVLQTALNSFINTDSIGDLDLEIFSAVQLITGERINLVSFRGTQAYKTWMKNQPAFLEVLGAMTKGKPYTKTVKGAAKRFMVGLLIEYLKQSRKPVTLPNICIELGNMKKIINDNFPGYLNNELGGLIMKGIKGGK